MRVNIPAFRGERRQASEGTIWRLEKAGTRWDARPAAGWAVAVSLSSRMRAPPDIRDSFPAKAQPAGVRTVKSNATYYFDDSALHTRCATTYDKTPEVRLFKKH